jgi:hypothetical protein
MWLFMLVPETLLIVVLGSLVRRLGARGLLAIGIFASSAR